jgi:hypothetical protein
MSGENWTNRTGGKGEDYRPESDEDVGYKAWRTNSHGYVRDISFYPAKGSGELIRSETYMQAISLEMSEDERMLCLMCHTSGQLVFISGQNLGDLKRQISEKKIQSVHVFSDQANEKMPTSVVTAIGFQQTFSQMKQPN